jgi:hypothetical protein
MIAKLFAVTLCYNPLFASNSLSFLLFGVPGLIRTVSAFFVFTLVGLCLVSCSSYNAPSGNRGGQSGIKFRAFVSNPVHPSFSGGGFPALDIVDATTDNLSPFFVSLATSVPDAGMMALSPKRDRTLVLSSSNHGLAIVDNASESAAGSLSLPGATDSFLVWTDNTTAFVAIPGVSVNGQSSLGEVLRINITNGSITATIPITGAHFLVANPDGSKILVISDAANTVTVLDPNQINSVTPLATITGFDKPVGAVFSPDGSTAYVLNCGAECGGISASVAAVDMNQPVPPVTIPVPAATTALLSGNTLYVAGTPPPGVGVDCQATLCGVVTLISGNAVQSSIPITDGYHDRIAMGSNSQLFVGSRTCTGVAASGSASGRGCLSVLADFCPTSTAAPGCVPQGTTPCAVSGNTAVLCTGALGDVTAIEPIPRRDTVYVCQGGKLVIYNTATDAPPALNPPSQQQQPLIPQTTPEQPNVVGQAVDVKVVDF